MTQRIDLSKIPPAPKGPRRLPFRETLDSKDLGLDVGIMRIVGKLRVEGEIEYAEGEIVLGARVAGVKSFDCSRCLELIEKPFEKEIFIAFESGVEPVDALPEIGEEIMVDAPINVLCREACPGLCARCGANLNLADCGCPKKP